MNSRLLRLFLRVSDVIHPKILAKFGNLRKNLAKAALRIEFRVYMGLMVLTSLLVIAGTFGTSLLLLSYFKPVTLHPLPLSALIGLIAGSITVGICYSYPMLVASGRTRKIDANLSLTANFMAVLASSGMPPESIFTALADVGEEFSISKEIAGVMRDIKLMGLDINTALRNASERSPSSKFTSMLEGVVTTIHMGGDLAGYLREQANKFKRERMINLRQFLDNLSVVAEAYVSFLVAAPLMLIVMLSVLSFMEGQVTLLSLDPKIILNVLSFVVIPAGISVLILAVDYLNPKR